MRWFFVGREEVAHFLHLPFWARVTHPKARRPMGAMALSITIMVVSSGIATQAEWITCHVTWLPHVVVDATAYLLHGIGAVPFVKYAEPVWAILIGAEEVVP